MGKINIRNIAIIAHVDHGKTSLVNEMLKQGGVFRENQEVADRIMDSNVLEKERGITIISKNTAIKYQNIKINMIDTPGHADFGGEVERILKMVDGVLLVVDAFEGPMPQTRFVLEKALELNHKVIVVINKIDKKDARIKEVINEVLELFLELNANEEQLNSPFIYVSSRFGTSSVDANKVGKNFTPLFQTIIDYIDAPKGSGTIPFQMLVSSCEHNDYLGKLAVGKVENGFVKVGDMLAVTNYHEEIKKPNFKISNIFVFDGLKRVPVDIANTGEIVCICGSDETVIGDTLCDVNNIKSIPFVKISEPSMEMLFMVNDSPFNGKEGKYHTSRHLKERLHKEAVKDLSLRVINTDSPDKFKVLGRGEMHISVLIENMRRDGFEFQVSMPQVIIKEIDGIKCEPIERVFFDVPDECVGSVMNAMGVRKGEFKTMFNSGKRTKMEFLVPSRGLFGYKSEFLTATRGEGIINTIFHGYQAYKGHIERRNFGTLIAFERGEAIQYGLYNTQERGKLLIGVGEKVYGGMVVGVNLKGGDIVVNVCKKKQLSNMRSSSSDEALRLEPIKKLTLEECLEFLSDDELLEVTPLNLRIRKLILDHTQRGRADFRKKNNL